MHFLFPSVITSLPAASCVSILCIKVGQRSKCLKDFKLAEKEDRRPLSFCWTGAFCSGGWAAGKRVSQCWACLHNHDVWIWLVLPSPAKNQQQSVRYFTWVDFQT